MSESISFPFWVGNRVLISGQDAPGKIMGFGTSNGQPVAIVQLDTPVWTEGREFFISVIVVHATSLSLVEPLLEVEDYA